MLLQPKKHYVLSEGHIITGVIILFACASFSLFLFLSLHDFSDDRAQQYLASRTTELSRFAPQRILAEAVRKNDPHYDLTTRNKQDQVRNAFIHAWKHYDQYCFGQDELLPLSSRCHNWLGVSGIGLTIVDSIDTMYLMGLDTEYEKARQWIQDTLPQRFKQDHFISFFETTIRVLGGLLSMYDMTKDALYLQRAEQVGEKLSKAFSSPTGIPFTQINLATGNTAPAWTGNSILAEVGTVQLEFAALSRHLGTDKYRKQAENVIERLDKAVTPLPGLYPVDVDPRTGAFTSNTVSWGAMGDSFYEYLLKMWIITGKKHSLYQKMYQKVTQAMFTHLLAVSSDKFTYIREKANNINVEKMDHLVCFAPGMLALGVTSGIVSGATADQHLKAAKDLTRTCYSMYTIAPSGLSPEFVNFLPGMAIGSAPAYKQRPEVLESLFIMWRTTHDPMYREWGWQIFEAIERHSRVDKGYTDIQNVLAVSQKEDKMESYFLAETLKYLFLLFSPDTLIPLNKFVFNTEAHPLAIFP